MQIHGLAKLTLLDYPGRVACTVFLGGCDFRCPFCHNFDIATGKAYAMITDEYLLSFLERRRSVLEGVAISGGEPCLRPELPDLLRRIRELGYAVKLDTNGNHPRKLAELLEAGLVDYVAMDIKNSPAKYARTVGLESIDLAPIRESVKLLLWGKVDYEFRTTVVDELHAAEDFEAIAAWISGARRYALQPFVDRDTVPFDGLHAPSRAAMEGYLEIVRPRVIEAFIRGMV